MKDFTLLILGADANAYYMARCYHEKYDRKAYIIAKNPIWFTSLSEITIPTYYDDIWDEKKLIKHLNDFYEEHKDKKILLVCSTENYITMISKNSDKLKDKFFFNYPKKELIDIITNKELFYKEYMNDNIIKLPKTLYYDTVKDNDINLNLTYPLIVKAANVVEYRKLNFEGKNKIYKVETKEELDEILSNIKNGGYKDTLIIQEYIPGDDSHLFDSVIYADENAVVKRVSFAQIGLQEHTKDLVGNAACLINGYSTFGDTSKIVEDIRMFAEKIGYTGFAEFDLKYDERDNSFKVLEINPRQGRSSYYISKCGCNLIEMLADDLIYKEKIEYKFMDKEVMLSFVPRHILSSYIVNDKYKKKALSMWHKHIDPMKYSRDLSLKRRYVLFRKSLRYYKDYKNGYWSNK